MNAIRYLALSETNSKAPVVTDAAFSAIAGAVSDFLSMGFKIPPNSEGFRFSDTFSAMCGFVVGSAISKRIASIRLMPMLVQTPYIAIGFVAALSYTLLRAVSSATELQSSNDMIFPMLSWPSAQARRPKLRGIGYGVRSDFELNFGRYLPALGRADGGDTDTRPD